MKKLTSILLVLLTFVMFMTVSGCENSNNSASTENSSTENISTSTTSENSQSSSSSQSTSSSLDIVIPTEPVVYFVGDSTVCNYTESGEAGRYTMRNGYGMRVGEYLNDTILINNLAISGRSSKSFLTEKNYQILKASLKKGDYLVIGFGHNDQKTDTTRFTDPTKPIDAPTSFQYSLYEYYIKLAEEVEATPILCTPVVRRATTYSGDKIHQANGGDYKQNIIDLGQVKNVTVVDLTTLTLNLFKDMPTVDTAKYYSWQISAATNPDGSKTVTVDNTHLNAFGAQVVAKMFVEEIAKTDCSLKNYIKSELATPDYLIVKFKEGNFTFSVG